MTTLQSVVRDARTGEALPGVALDVLGSDGAVLGSAVSDARGHASCGVALAFPDTLTLRARQDDFVLHEAMVKVTRKDRGKVVASVIEMPPQTASVCFRIRTVSYVSGR